MTESDESEAELTGWALAGLRDTGPIRRVLWPWIVAFLLTAGVSWIVNPKSYRGRIHVSLLEIAPFFGIAAVAALASMYLRSTGRFAPLDPASRRSVSLLYLVPALYLISLSVVVGAVKGSLGSLLVTLAEFAVIRVMGYVRISRGPLLLVALNVFVAFLTTRPGVILAGLGVLMNAILLLSLLPPTGEGLLMANEQRSHGDVSSSAS